MNSRRNLIAATVLGAALVPAFLLLSQGAASAQDGFDFQKKCLSCHGETAPPTVKGPSLKGVFGRTIASQKGFEYSAGLKAKSGKWTQANLDAFLTKPGDFAPGTKMKASVADPAMRAQEIELLKKQ